MSARRIPRLLVAGVASGVGKTTVTVALARALQAQGRRVALFKCGPDYLDPTYHRLVSGRPSHNLDGWMMGREAVLETFLAETSEADIALIEGVMGLFDGRTPRSLEGSSAEIAGWLDAPVLLVVDASGMARSVAALAQGFAQFDRSLTLAGVFCNRVGSASHLDLLREACPSPPVVGGMLREEVGAFPSRHLGLEPAEQTISQASLDSWCERLARHTDLARVLALADCAPALPCPAPAPAAQGKRCRIGFACDDAFFFYYPYNLRLLERFGAELVPFSPLADARLPQVDGLYLGGGYPELHAQALEDNLAMRRAVRDFAARGGPIYAECGGLMYLSEAIIQRDGGRREMVGVLPGAAVMQPKLAALGYVEVHTAVPTLLGEAGLVFRGHQFRYSRFEAAKPPTQYRLHARRSAEPVLEGYGEGNVLASYVHAHWASCPRAAAGFVSACSQSHQLF